MENFSSFFLATIVVSQMLGFRFAAYLQYCLIAASAAAAFFPSELLPVPLLPYWTRVDMNLRERFSSLTRFPLLINLRSAQCWHKYFLNTHHHCRRHRHSSELWKFAIFPLISAAHWGQERIGEHVCTQQQPEYHLVCVLDFIAVWIMVGFFGVFACISLYTCMYLSYEIETRRTSRHRRWRRQHFSPSLLLFNFRTDGENNETRKKTTTTTLTEFKIV